MDKKLPKPQKKDREWQDKIAKKLAKEKVQLNHPQGMEQFRSVIKRVRGKKP